MRKFFVAFLMLAMLTPGLACDWVLGTSKAHAALITQLPKSDLHINKNQTIHKVMLFKDYSKAHLITAGDTSLLHKAAFQGKVFPMAWQVTASAQASIPSEKILNRGPPLNWPKLSQLQPPLLLSTLRLRL